jgi:hypothetical protein
MPFAPRTFAPSDWSPASVAVAVALATVSLAVSLTPAVSVGAGLPVPAAPVPAKVGLMDELSASVAEALISEDTEAEADDVAFAGSGSAGKLHASAASVTESP